MRTQQEIANNVAHLTQKPIKELRKMQAIVQLQITKAHKSKNAKAFSELISRDKEITEAIVLQFPNTNKENQQ